MPDDDNVRRLRPQHPDDDPPTPAELADAEVAIDMARDAGLCAFLGDGTDTMRLTWQGVLVLPVLNALLDLTVTELVAQGHLAAALLHTPDATSRAAAVARLLAKGDATIDRLRAQLLARIEGDD